jgi:hypothetical protein
MFCIEVGANVSKKSIFAYFALCLRSKEPLPTVNEGIKNIFIIKALILFFASSLRAPMNNVTFSSSPHTRDN